MSVVAVEGEVQAATDAVDELRRLARLAVPVVAGMLAFMTLGVVDTIMLGRVSAEALGVSALAHLWGFSSIVVARGAMHGLDPAVAQAHGAGDRAGVARALGTGLTFAALLAVPVTAAHLVGEAGLRLLGQPEELVGEAGRFVRVLGVGVLPTLLFGAVRHTLVGIGDVRPATVAAILVNLLNVALNTLFIYGWGPVPAMGAVGCAWSTVLCEVTLLGLVLWLGAPSLSSLTRWREGLVDRVNLWRVAGLGLPVGFQQALELWAFNLAMVMMGWLGPLQVAAHAVAINLASLAFMVPFGIAAAASTRVGNLLGAGLPWTRAAWLAVAAGAAVMGLSATLFALTPELLAGAYTRDPEVLALAASLLPIAACFQLVDGTQTVAFGALRGAGDVRVPTLANVAGYYVVGLPLGYALAFWFGWGPHGVWAGLAVALAVVAGLLLLRLRVTARRGGVRV